MKIDTNEAGELFTVIEKNNLSIPEVIKILSNPVQDWVEKDGVIYLPPLISDGTTGPNWISRLKVKGHSISKYAKSVLNSPEFKTTDGTIYYPAILKGELFSDNERVTKNIRKKAEELNLRTPNPEVACLIRENFSDEEIEAMGLLWVIAMHEPINDSVGSPWLLGVDRFGYGSWLVTSYGLSVLRWYRHFGFAFVVSQVSSS